MKNLISISIIGRLKKLNLSLLFILLTAFTGSFGQASSQAELCRKALFAADKVQARLELIKDVPVFKHDELISELKKDGKLLFKGDHQHRSGSEFLASNEFDWPLSPFDHKEGDVLVAFATNSAWEIAADKNVKNLIIGDWSPSPLIAQAFIWAPMWKIANSPTELILLMGGVIPTPQLLKLDFHSALQYSLDAFERQDRSRGLQLFDFLEYLAREPLVSDLELKAMTSYFISAMGFLGSNDAFGPFPKLHPSQALGILDMIQLRYDHTGGIPQNRKLKNTESVYHSQSVFHNLQMFRRVKQLYVGGSVRYALTAAENPVFYQKVREEFPEPNTRFALSLSNIFDCGSYNCLTFSSLQETLRSATESLGASAQAPLVVFRTTNDRPPHGFYRYDIPDVSKVPQKDEVDSRASPRFDVDAAAEALSWLLQRVSRQ